MDLLRQDFVNRNFEGLSARFEKTSLVPVGLALVASLNLIQTFNIFGLQRTVLRKADVPGAVQYELNWQRAVGL